MALIARHATGSFRDALGTLEQLVTYAGGRPIEPADVLAVLGVADAEQLFEAVDAIIARDPARALRAAAQARRLGPRPRPAAPRPRGPRPRAARGAGARRRPARAAGHPGARQPPRRAGHRAVATPTRSGCSTWSRPRSRRPPTAPRPGSSSSSCWSRRRRPRSIRRWRRCWRGSSGSRAAASRQRRRRRRRAAHRPRPDAGADRGAAGPAPRPEPAA